MCMYLKDGHWPTLFLPRSSQPHDLGASTANIPTSATAATTAMAGTSIGVVALLSAIRSSSATAHACVDTSTSGDDPRYFRPQGRR